MNITLDFPGPLKKGVVGKFSEAVGLANKAPPLKCFGGQIFFQNGSCGSVRLEVTEKRDRIVLSTNYNNAHMCSFQLLIIAMAAARLGEKPKLTFGQEFAHTDLSHWFPGRKQESNLIHLEGTTDG